MDDTDRPGLADPRVRVVSAVLYVAGLALMIIGSVGAYLWTRRCGARRRVWS